MKCSNFGCPVAQNGKCLEGLSLEKCPHYGKDAPLPTRVADAQSEANNEQRVTQQRPERKLPTADLINVDQAGTLCCSLACKSVAFVGPSNAGKSSLIAALYEKFQEGILEGYSCKWSDTLQAFERICHHARLVSQRDVAYTEHTRLKTGLHYYHLRLRSDSSDLELLLADRAGELYSSAANDPSTVKDHVELRRADTINLLLDGKKLADVGQRHNAKTELRQILQGIIDSDVLGPVRRVALVLTKMDELLESPRAAVANEEFETYFDSLQRTFGDQLTQFQPFKIAASPTIGEQVARGHGIQDLFRFWVHTPAPSLREAPVSLTGRIFQDLKAPSEHRYGG